MRAARDAADDEAAAARRGRAARHRRDRAHEPERVGRWPRSASPGRSTDQVERLAALAQTAGLDGVVASPQEIALIRRSLRRSRSPSSRRASAAADDDRGDQTPDDVGGRRPARRRHLSRRRPADHRGARPASGGRADRRRVPARSAASLIAPDALLAPRLPPVRRDEGGRRAASRRSVPLALEEIDISERCRARSASTALEIPVLLVDGKKVGEVPDCGERVAAGPDGG